MQDYYQTSGIVLNYVCVCVEELNTGKHDPRKILINIYKLNGRFTQRLLEADSAALRGSARGQIARSPVPRGAWGWTAHLAWGLQNGLCERRFHRPGGEKLDQLSDLTACWFWEEFVFTFHPGTSFMIIASSSRFSRSIRKVLKQGNHLLCNDR